MLDRFTGSQSFKALPQQVEVITKDVERLMKKYPRGINLIGYSQGTAFKITFRKNFFERGLVIVLVSWLVLGFDDY